jgi:hypothetical protein
MEYFICDFSVKGVVACDVGEGLEKTKVQVMVVGGGLQGEVLSHELLLFVTKVRLALGGGGDSIKLVWPELFSWGPLEVFKGINDLVLTQVNGKGGPIADGHPCLAKVICLDPIRSP